MNQRTTKLGQIARALVPLALGLTMLPGTGFAATQAPSWTQANSGDPGVTLLSAPAFLAENTTFRSGTSSTPPWPRVAMPR